MAIQYNARLDRTFHALGDGTRREIIAMLAAQGACSANELRAPFDVAQPTISKHLKVLEKAGLVERKIDGRTHRFQLIAKTMDDAQSWISRHKAFWTGTLDRLEIFVEDLDTTDTRESNS